MATQTGIIGPYSKAKNYCFLTISKSVSPIFLQNLILRAVAIKLYCSKLHFEHYFCLNNRCFVFSTIDNNFDSGCHSNKIWNEAKFLCQVLTTCKVSNKSNRRLLRYSTFIFFFVLQYCVCDIIFKWKWGWKPSKWRCPSCPNSWLWNGISREPFGALRSVRAGFFAFFTLFHLSLTFFSTGGSL